MPSESVVSTPGVGVRTGTCVLLHKRIHLLDAVPHKPEFTTDDSAEYSLLPRIGGVCKRHISLAQRRRLPRHTLLSLDLDTESGHLAACTLGKEPDTTVRSA